MPSLRRDLVARLAKATRLACSSRRYFAHATKLLLGCVTRRGRQTFLRNLRGLSLPPIGEIPYDTWIVAHVRGRGERYPLRPAPGLFSFLTTVYDTKARYVRRLRDSVLAQTL